MPVLDLGCTGQPQAGRPTDVTSLSTGIVFLGLVSPKDFREKAQAAGVDAVCRVQRRRHAQPED